MTRPVITRARSAVVGLEADTHIYIYTYIYPFCSHLLLHSPSVFWHKWTSHPIGIWVTCVYDSLHLHSCTHIHNMTLTDTINTNCHRSYSSYCNEYLFDTATSKQQVYMHKLKKSNSNRAHPHQITKSTKDKSYFCQPAIYLHTICDQLAHLWLNSTCNLLALQFAINLLICDSILLAIYLHYNLLSTCSFVTQFYL